LEVKSVCRGRKFYLGIVLKLCISLRFQDDPWKAEKGSIGPRGTAPEGGGSVILRDENWTRVGSVGRWIAVH